MCSNKGSKNYAALALTLITSPTDSVYESVSLQLRRTVLDSELSTTKACAINTLSIATFFCDTLSDEKNEVLDFFFRIISSDGNYADANDSVEVVASALEAWGFLATLLEDVRNVIETALESFTDQLDSTYTTIKLAAGENIALLYESGCTLLDEDEEISNDEEILQLDNDSPSGKALVRKHFRADVENQLRQALVSLSTVSDRHISKKDKKSLHINFADILNSVDNPLCGPRYHNAIDYKCGKRYGNRLIVKIGRTGEIRIDRWWKLHRFKALKRVLQGGFMVHYEYNGVILDSLP